ncbi:MAG: phosphotransferase family protein [Proteobacteria bacterium]|nr:phosphotransferase family protein [Pseudomonadota bacterium]
MDAIDQATTIRKGEELDSRKIETFLKDTVPNISGPFSIEQFPSGYSNLTYLVRTGNSEMVLRRPPLGTKAKSSHDMGREYRVLSALHPFFPYCPKPLVYTEDESILGAPFYVMERITGIILRKDLPQGLSFTDQEAETLCRNFVDAFVTLHSVDYVEAGLENLGRPAGYVERQINGWIKRYRAARTPDAPGFEEVMQWLVENMPQDDPKPALIHNDFKLDNMVLDPANPVKIVGVLDWEMTTVGDPLMDLGASLAYWIEQSDSEANQARRRSPTHIDGALTRRELVEQYALKSGKSLENIAFYRCYGLFRLAGIDQQIYYRYFHGQTKDERFKDLIDIVGTLEESARKLIRSA